MQRRGEGGDKECIGKESGPPQGGGGSMGPRGQSTLHNGRTSLITSQWLSQHPQVSSSGHHLAGPLAKCISISQLHDKRQPGCLHWQHAKKKKKKRKKTKESNYVLRPWRTASTGAVSIAGSICDIATQGCQQDPLCLLVAWVQCPKETVLLCR